MELTNQSSLSNYMKILNPGLKYYVLSKKHTDKKDKYVTLWRPDNKGYCYMIEAAGMYDGFQEGYHRDGGNIPLLTDHLPKKFIVADKEGRICIKNSPSFWKYVDALQTVEAHGNQ